MKVIIDEIVIFEDEYLVAINKPPGTLSIPGGFSAQIISIRELLQEKYGKIWTIHRLDKDTSGVILFAKSAESHKDLNQQFQEHNIQKIYHAWVLGTPAWEEKTVELPLRINGDRNHRTIVDDERGKPARTKVSVIERFNRITKISAEILTGYTHQIRAHCSNIGFPLLGDSLYKYPKHLSQNIDPIELFQIPDFSRTALHASFIGFKHPVSSNFIEISANYPEDLSALEEKLANK